MKKDIIFAGVGGQGVISAAAMLVTQMDLLGFKCKQNEVHGMAQRGGSVVCHVRLSSDDIFSDMVPKGSADIIAATEPMEAVRYMDYLAPNGVVITSNRPVLNIEYPDVGDVIADIKSKSRAVIIDADKFVEECKNERAINVAVLGAISKELKTKGLKEGIFNDIKRRFSKKGDAIVEMNHKALAFGESAAV